MRFFWGAWSVGGVSVKVHSAGRMVGGFTVDVGGVRLTGFFRTGLAAKTAGFAAARTGGIAKAVGFPAVMRRAA